MSRLSLLVAFLVCVSCSESPKPAAEEKAAPKVETPAPAAPVAAAPAETPAGSDGPPEFILFPSSYGDVKYTHRQHYERVKGVCVTCHPSVFPMAREPLTYGKARHRDAEERKISCATCHGISGTAFAAERNCQRCHDMKSKH
jgi:c(7)-type cytochrome triheme protein